VRSGFVASEVPVGLVGVVMTQRVHGLHAPQARVPGDDIREPVLAIGRQARRGRGWA